MILAAPGCTLDGVLIFAGIRAHPGCCHLDVEHHVSVMGQAAMIRMPGHERVTSGSLGLRRRRYEL